MQQLIYASRPIGFSRAVLDDILSVSRRKNGAFDITGALICRPDIYLQLLEGPAAAVDTLFGNICRDRRHDEVTTLIECPVEDRLFPDWSMWHDPERSWLWTPEEVGQGAIKRASVLEVRAVFVRAANQSLA